MMLFIAYYDVFCGNTMLLKCVLQIEYGGYGRTFCNFFYINTFTPIG